MKLKTRRILYILTILLFLGVTPVLLAFGFGIRYNPDSKSIVKTGGIYINTFPKNLTISLDGKTSQEKTPLRMRSLWPKIYTLDISKNGYYSLQTTIDIQQSQVFLFDPIELIPQQPINEVSVQSEQYFASPFGPQLLLFSKDFDGTFSASYFEVNEKKNIFGKLSHRPTKVFWNGETGDALIDTETGQYMYTANKETIIALPTNFTHAVLAAKDPGMVYGFVDNKTFIFNSSDKTTTASSVSGAVVYKHNGLFAVFTDANGTSTLSIQNGNDSTVIQTLPEVLSITTFSKQYALIECSRETYLLDAANKKLLYLDSSISAYTLSREALYYANGFEVWKLDIATSEKALVNRFSDKIDSLSVSPHESGLFIHSLDKTLFWYLRTQKQTSVQIDGLGLVQRVDDTHFQSLTNKTEGDVSIRTYVIE